MEVKMVLLADFVVVSMYMCGPLSLANEFPRSVLFCNFESSDFL